MHISACGHTDIHAHTHVMELWVKFTFFFFSKNLFLSFSYPTVLDNLTGLRKSLCSRINYYSL